MTTQHTPAPWAVDLEDGSVFTDDDDVHPQIAYVLGENTEPEQFRADCHLIAAAPELLRVAEEILDYMDAGAKVHIPEFREFVVAALAKARGGI